MKITPWFAHSQAFLDGFPLSDEYNKRCSKNVRDTSKLYNDSEWGGGLYEAQ